jgi:hypothetical protein
MRKRWEDNFKTGVGKIGFEAEVDGTGWESCTMVGFDISGVEHLDVTTTVIDEASQIFTVP